MSLKTKPCPFCQSQIGDTGGACCFCDYQGEVTIGYVGHFDTIGQYNKIFYATSFKEQMDELHGRNDSIRIIELK